MKKIAIVYWSGTGNTEEMANCIEAGVKAGGGEPSLMQCSSFNADMIADYDGFAFGCPACDDEGLDDTEFLPMWKTVREKLGDKPVVMFGSYGWGGGEFLKVWMSNNPDLNIIDSFACLEDPDDEAKGKCEALGAKLAK